MTILELQPRTQVRPADVQRRTGSAVIDMVGETPAVPAASEPRARRLRRLGYGLLGCGLALLPWMFVLATATAAHWPLAWVGLDTLEALGLITTGLLAVRHDHRYALPATATAALLLVDAWFDTTTAAPGNEFVSALVMAVGAELPLAVLCTVMAVRALPRATS
jgi:hypothetical protein